jgi:DnaJ-class molecular chaperone
MSKIQEVIDEIKRAQTALLPFTDAGAGYLVSVLALLAEVAKELQCPVCKGEGYEIVDGKVGTPAEKLARPEHCSACGGTGTAKAYYEKRIAADAELIGKLEDVCKTTDAIGKSHNMFHCSCCKAMLEDNKTALASIEAWRKQ